MKNNKRHLIGLLLAFVLAFSLLPAGALAATAADYEGKTVSILGDSISTYTGVSNNASYNSTIGSNAVYYTAGKLGVYRSDTWWQQAIDAMGMELLVNNAWSGSAIHTDRAGLAAYKDRCVQLHNDTTNVDPDVIWSFLGTNDFSWYYASEWGTVDAVAFDTLIVEGTDGTYTYGTPSTVFEAYAVMLHKMTQRYPNAEIYVMGLLARREPSLASSYKDNGQPTTINAGIKTLVEKMGCTYVDLESRISSDPAEFDIYIGDQKVHPGPLGHDVLTTAVLSAMLGKETTTYNVSSDLRGATSDNDAHIVLSDSAYTANLSLAEGYSAVDVTVTMGGEDITASCYDNGVISIDAVSGDVEITATGTAAFTGQYRWEMNAAGDALVSVTTDGNTENALTLTNGSISGGALNQACYSIEDTVYLLPTEEWAIEWKGSGNWRGLMLTTNDANTAGMTYLYHSETANLFALGTYNGSSWQNYGLILPESISLSEMHTFRVENRLSEDGSNMAYLVVDDMEIGALNNYYSGTTNKNSTVDWIDGQTLKFNHMGKVANTHYLTMELEHLQIWASAPQEHKHAYTITASKAANCFEKGIVTYSCSTCGDSYDVVSEVDADNHVYGAWLPANGQVHRACEGCGVVESKAMLAYRWEMNTAGDELVSVTTDGNTANPLTMTNGTVSGGVLSEACFAMQDAVTLLPTDEWVIEWKSSGDWHGLLLCTNDANTSGMNYLYRNKSVPFMALGTYDSAWHNYAITDTADTSSHHVYRVENRVAADGTNTAYYLIDGVEVGALTTYYKAATNQNTSVNWINGQTLTFQYMGKTANSHYLSMDLDYLQIWANGEPETLADALDALGAAGGGTFKLPCDVSASSIILRPGVTLDLNGQTLTCSYFVGFEGSHVIDSGADKTGAVKCAKNALTVSSTNAQIPIWNGADGYFFESFDLSNKTGSSADGTYTYIFRPEFATDARAAVVGANGGDASGFSIKALLKWDGGERALTYKDEFVKQVYADSNKAFYAWITTYENYVDKNLKIQTVVVSDFGTEIAGEALSIS